MRRSIRRRGQCRLGLESLEPRMLLSGAVTTLLNSQFAGTGLLGGASWHLSAWAPGTYIGRTQFVTAENGPMPSTGSGAVHLTLNSYNPTMLPGQPSFYGTDLVSNQTFTPTAGTTLDIKVRAKLDVPLAGGYVGGLFLYPATPIDGQNNEVDFELVSNQAANGQNAVETNVYANEPLGAGNPLAVALPANGKLTGWHVYEIKLDPGVSVSWLIDGKLVRTETSIVPTVPMQLHLNLWAPDTGWAWAYNAGINPVSDPSANARWTMSVDYATVQAVQDPVKVASVSVGTSTNSLFQNGALTGTGTIAATGYGKIQYYWVAQSPNGKVAKVGSTHTVTIANANAALPACTDLPRSALGNYSVWAHIVSAGNVMNSNTAGYTVNEIPLSIRITHVPPAGVWGVSLRGVAAGTYIKNYKVAVLINVGGWYTKPYWNQPDTKINSNGTWSCLVTTGGFDATADEFRAYLLPKSMKTPLADGNLPDELAPYLYADAVR